MFRIIQHRALGREVTKSSLHTQSHHPTALVQAVIDTTKPSAEHWSTEKMTAVRDLIIWISDFARELAPVYANPHQQWDIHNEALIDCFALVKRIWFFDALDHTRIEWRVLPPDRFGQTLPRGEAIYVDPVQARDVSRNAQSLATFVLAIVLHEAAHAYLMSYAYHAPDHGPCNKLRGYTGHGMAWQTLAFELERHVAQMGVEGVDLKRFQSAQLEAGTHLQATAPTRKRWSLSRR